MEDMARVVAKIRVPQTQTSENIAESADKQTNGSIDEHSHTYAPEQPNQGDTQPPKQLRGHPRKRPVEHNNLHTNGANEEHLPKNEEEESKAFESDTTQPTKRPRGRQMKRPLDNINLSADISRLRSQSKRPSKQPKSRVRKQIVNHKIKATTTAVASTRKAQPSSKKNSSSNDQPQSPAINPRLNRPRNAKLMTHKHRTLHLIDGPPIRPDSLLAYIQSQYNGKWLQTTVYNPLNRDTIQHCNRYAASAYECMNTDRTRVGLYQGTIASYCAGKVVMDIGTGPHALLAAIALQAGAVRVHAIETRKGDVAQAAKRLFELVYGSYPGDKAVTQRSRGCLFAKEPSFTVVHGHSSQLLDMHDPDFEDVLLDADVIVHEIFDEVMSGEGVFTVIAKIQRRRLELHMSLPQSIPQRASSLIAPVRLPVPDVDVHFAPAVMSPANKVMFLFHVPESCWLGHAQPFEELDFNAVLDDQVELIDGVPTMSRTLTFRMRRSGHLIGFVIILSIELTDEVELRTTRDKHTNWRNPIVLLPQGHTHAPLRVSAGDVLEIQTRVWFHDHRPDYDFTITNASRGIVKQNPHLGELIGVTQRILFEEMNYVEGKSDRIRSYESIVD